MTTFEKSFQETGLSREEWARSCRELWAAIRAGAHYHGGQSCAHYHAQLAAAELEATQKS